MIELTQPPPPPPSRPRTRPPPPPPQPDEVAATTTSFNNDTSFSNSVLSVLESLDNTVTDFSKIQCLSAEPICHSLYRISVTYWLVSK